MRVAGVPSLRSQRCMKVMRAAFRGGKERLGFRLVHYRPAESSSPIVEAKNKRALSSGARGLAIRVAMRLNHLLGRKGKVFSERYHAVALGSPRQVRRALAYVLLQERRHAAGGQRALTTRLDRCSSAPGFDGFKNVAPRARALEQDGRPKRVRGSSQHRRWRRHGAIDPARSPGRTLLRASGDLAEGPWSAWAREPDVSMVSVERTCDPLGVQRTARLFALAEHLRARRTGVTAEELAELFGVTVRTIYQPDLDALRDAHLPLHAERGREGDCRARSRL